MSRPTRVAPVAAKLAARAAVQRYERRRRWLRRTGLVAAVAAPLLLLGWLLLGSPLLAVRDVVVTGESRLTAAQVTAAAAVPDGTPLARVDTAAVRRRIGALGPVASVTVSRGWPHALRVTVVERVPLVALSDGSRFRLLDASGAEVATVASPPRGVLRLDSASDPATRAALRVLVGLPRGITGRLGALRAPSPEQVTLVLRDGRQVLWGGAVDGPTKASAVLALIGMPGTVFDVSAPGVATRR